MRVALLCPGPSLAAFPGREGFDAVVAVNRAALRVEADWWVMLDAPTAAYAPVRGRPTIVTRPTTWRRIQVANGPNAGLARAFLDPVRWERATVHWAKFSATAALVWAAHLGAAKIEVWGVDWSGREDWDGFTDDRQTRDERRWQKERTLWKELVGRLAARGVLVVRHLMEDRDRALQEQETREGREAQVAAHGD